MALFASLMMILSSHPVRAVLSMVLAFVSMAGIWMLLEDEFLSMALILVYVGAVMVLFLFVVMMLDLEAPALKKTIGMRQWIIGLLIFAMMYGFLRQGILDFGALNYLEPNPVSKEYSNIKALGEVLYTDYILPFEIAGVILLVAMVAAIGLAFRGRRSLTQQIDAQVRVSKADRLRIMKEI